MPICVLGINHKTATLEVRERFAVAEHDYPSHLTRLYQFPVVQSAVVISTCNRTEYYLSVPSIKAFKEQADEVLGFDSAANHVYLKTGQECAAHLFAVTAGVDSLVLGETQIQGQVKRAFDEASQFKQNGEMNKLFQMAFKTAKLVRSDTEIGRNPVSVAHCAVQLGRQIFGALEQQNALVVGAGETAELLIRYLINHGAQNLTVANRTAANAAKLAGLFNASTLGFDAVANHLHEFDLVFTATASPSTLIQQADALQALKRRKYKPMVMIDLSVPRDIDENIAQLEDVFLYAVDDLQKVITENIKRRASTIDEATRIIDAEAELLGQWIKRHRHHDLLKQYQAKVERIKQAVLDRQMTQDLSEEQANKLNTVAHQVSKKLSHDHISALRKIIESGNEEHIKLVADLLALEMNDDT
ncbi:glutamyl-tRNA reductase [Marinicella meishanensis]|uniref:glutamyl-tRNA reductase n=1 Tax=Marinicella meishanensis TaxID=2873263 RepID=UPI001CC1056C|nr:glutamyl-tRNA reductase [Marinicella sp. NBU2979]